MVAGHGNLMDAGPKSRSERRREDTRRKLMRAAYEIIADRGLEGLVIQEITQFADVGYGTFYNHFPSKDAVVDAVIESALLRILEIPTASAKSCLTRWKPSAWTCASACMAAGRIASGAGS